MRVSPPRCPVVLLPSVSTSFLLVPDVQAHLGVPLLSSVVSPLCLVVESWVPGVLTGVIASGTWSTSPALLQGVPETEKRIRKSLPKSEKSLPNSVVYYLS